MDLNQVLTLVPTTREFAEVRQHLPDELPVEICGFGPIAAGVESARLLCRPEWSEIRRVVLLGIGGTFDPAALPVGTAASFRHVWCYGVGAGTGDEYRSPADLGIAQRESGDLAACFDRLPLAPLTNGPIVDGLLTVTAASANAVDAVQRRDRHPDCLCEDMEGFSVALAASGTGVSVSVVRGISNVIGDRDHANWRIGPALQAGAQILREWLASDNQ